MEYAERDRKKFDQDCPCHKLEVYRGSYGDISGESDEVVLESYEWGLIPRYGLFARFRLVWGALTKGNVALCEQLHGQPIDVENDYRQLDGIISMRPDQAARVGMHLLALSAEPQLSNEAKTTKTFSA